MSDVDYPTEHAECPICSCVYCKHPACEEVVKKSARIAELEAKVREQALEYIALVGQMQDALEASNE